MKIVHVITGLSTGGAEMMLYKLLSRMNADEFDSEVISLTDAGPVADKIKMFGCSRPCIRYETGQTTSCCND